MSLVDEIAVELADFHLSNDPQDREVRAMAERAMAVVTPEFERLRDIEAAARRVPGSKVGTLPRLKAMDALREALER
jgi:hypothetical protein